MYSTAVRMKIRASYKRGQVSRRPPSKKICVRPVLLTVLAGGGTFPLDRRHGVPRGSRRNFAVVLCFILERPRFPETP